MLKPTLVCISPMFQEFINFLAHSNEFLVMALLLFAGVSLARLAKRFHLPKITGYIAAGMILGEPGLHLVNEDFFIRVSGINAIALGLMSITIGAHLNLHKLRNSGRRVFSVLTGECLLSFTLVFISLHFLAKQEIKFALLLAGISIATAPAATVAVVKDAKAKGLLVNTILPVVALNNVLCIIVFGLIADIMTLTTDGSLEMLALLHLLGKELMVSGMIGLGAGILLKVTGEKHILSSHKLLTLVFLVVLGTTGISKLFQVNPMLPCMIIGMVITNTSYHRSKILTIFEEIEYIIFIIFFCLAGAHIQLDDLQAAGFLGMIYFVARAIGKTVGGSLGAYILKTPSRVAKYAGVSLLPQAGLAIGLVILAKDIEVLQPIIDLLTTLVLAVVALNEIVGPPVTKYALLKSGDANQDRPKLIDFLHEEFVLADLKATNKEEAIKEMVSFFISSHKGSSEQEKQILESVLERENESSTGIGNGIAIPHGLTDEGPVIWGSLGLSHQGIDFDSIDDKPVKLIILVVTPHHCKADMHLAVISEFAKLLSNKDIREELFEAKNAQEICEILFREEQGSFNYFLDDQ